MPKNRKPGRKSGNKAKAKALPVRKANNGQTKRARVSERENLLAAPAETFGSVRLTPGDYENAKDAARRIKETLQEAAEKCGMTLDEYTAKMMAEQLYAGPKPTNPEIEEVDLSGMLAPRNYLAKRDVMARNAALDPSRMHWARCVYHRRSYLARSTAHHEDAAMSLAPQLPDGATIEVTSPDEGAPGETIKRYYGVRRGVAEWLIGFTAMEYRDYLAYHLGEMDGDPTTADERDTQ